MAVATVRLGKLSVSRFILGGNPFSGFAHQTQALDDEMRHYYTSDCIKRTLARAEQLGITAHLSRADHHVMRYLMEHWDQGGKIQWLAQTCPELGTIDRGVQNALNGGAKACYIHGGVMDFCLANQKFDEVFAAIEKIKQAGLPAGVAGHNPGVFAWAEQNLACDFYMCSYYNPTNRAANAEHLAGAQEAFMDSDRDAMVKTIAGLSKPAIHYKVLAAGRNDPRQALEFVARHLRPQDAVCIGVFPKRRTTELEDDVKLFCELTEKTLAAK